MKKLLWMWFLLREKQQYSQNTRKEFRTTEIHFYMTASTYKQKRMFIFVSHLDIYIIREENELSAYFSFFGSNDIFETQQFATVCLFSSV